MIRLLLWLASFSFASQGAPLPVESLKDENATQAVQQALDDKFSVSGGTLTGRVFISSGALTLGAGLNCTNAQGNCITFADATTLNTAPASLTGSNYFTSVSTINIAGYSNLWVLISSGDVYGVTAATIPVVPITGVNVSSTAFRLELDGMLLGGTATFPYLMVAGDNGTNYGYAGRCENTGGGAAQPGATGARLFPLWETTTTGQNQSFWGTLWFSGTYSKKNTRLSFLGGNTTNTLDSCRIGGLYTATQGASSLTITSNSVSDIALHWDLWQAMTHSP